MKTKAKPACIMELRTFNYHTKFEVIRKGKIMSAFQNRPSNERKK